MSRRLLRRSGDGDIHKIITRRATAKAPPSLVTRRSTSKSQPTQGTLT